LSDWLKQNKPPKNLATRAEFEAVRMALGATVLLTVSALPRTPPWMRELLCSAMYSVIFHSMFDDFGSNYEESERIADRCARSLR
jgi:hypothetical protein